MELEQQLQRSEQAEVRVEKFEVLLEQERQRTQALKAKLQGLGIDPEQL